MVLISLLSISSCKSDSVGAKETKDPVTTEKKAGTQTQAPIVIPAPEDLPEEPSERGLLIQRRLNKRASHKDWGLSVRDFTRVKVQTQELTWVEGNREDSVNLNGFDLAAIIVEQEINELSGEFVWQSLSSAVAELEKQNILSLASPILVVWGVEKPTGKPKFEIGVPVLQGTTVAPPLKIVKFQPLTVVQATIDRTAIHVPEKHLNNLPKGNTYQDEKAWIDDVVVKKLGEKSRALGLNPEMIMVQWPWHGLHDPKNPKTKFQVMIAAPQAK